MSVKQTFEQIQLSDTYTRNIVYGYIRNLSHNFSFIIPSIIYELCVSFYYAGEHFAYLGDEMDIISENDNKSLRTYNNICEMTTDSQWNTCYGQIIIDTKLKTSYIYEWIFRINTSYSTSIGFGISTEYDRTDDAFWICTKSNPEAKYYAFTASINGAKLSLLSSASSSWITYDQSLSNHDTIKLIFNIKKKTLQCIINDKDNKNIIVPNIETNKLKYHLSISMCGRYKIRLLDFQRINTAETEQEQIYLNENNKNKNRFNNFGDIEVGILSKSMSDILHNDDMDNTDDLEEGDIITLRKIIYDYQLIKTVSSRKQLIYEFANKKIKIKSFSNIEDVYGLIELIILLVIRNRYKDNVIFTQNYYKDVSQFVEYIYYDENNMDGNQWSIQQFASCFDQWIAKIVH